MFYELIDRTLRRGRDVIVLVPEILLTVQMVSRIKSRYGGLVAVMHSNLSAGERLDEWKRMKLGLAKIAVGTRCLLYTSAPVSPRRNGRSAALQDNCPRKTRSGCCSAALRPDKSCTGKP